MNIEQARAVPLALILDAIGCQPQRQRNHRARYLSPLRNERTASFHVDHAQNLWYDFGIDKGGSVIEFARSWLDSRNEASTIPDALRWIGNMSGTAPFIKSLPATDTIKDDSCLILKDKRPIRHSALVSYLAKRGIPLSVASTCIEEVTIHNTDTNKDFFALGFANEDKGYELRNPFFKGCIGPKTISFFRGRQPKPKGIHIFEGFIDYVSAITYRKVTQFEDDTIVLNSLSCLKQATPYIKNYGYEIAYTWLDNDDAGRRGTQSLKEFFQTEKNLQHRPMNDLYLPDKDVNAWHMKSLKLHL